MPSESFLRQDARLTVTRALPSTTAAVQSAAIDLGSGSGLNALVGTTCDIVLEIPATTTATGQTITLVLQDSTDGVSFAQIAACNSLTLTGVSNATAATTRIWRLPPTVRRFIRLSVSPSATAGDQSAFTATLQVKT
jgi:hypothetical protein